MDRSGAQPPSGAAAAGWYPDPGGSGSMRFWDGSRWTDAVSSAVPPAGPTNARDDARGRALAAHLSALPSLFVGVPFVGPLAVYVTARDDPFVRRHAAEALSFNLSVTLYAIALGVATLAIAPLAVASLIALAIAWIVLVCLAAARAGRGGEFRYPLTIRLVR